jgi:RNA polymerase sigma-70 factor (ECF subfamily)
MVPAERSEMDLVTAARSGDNSAFAELYQRHRGAVRLAVSDNVHDRETCEDIMQESFIRAFASLEQLKDAKRFRPWVLQIARNAGIDSRRRTRRLTVDSIDDDNARELRSSGPDPAELSELRELAQRVESGMARMSRRDALVLSLSTEFGFGPTEIASALGITPNNAKVVLHRARQRLRLAIELETA